MLALRNTAALNERGACMTDLPPENVQSYPRPPALEPVPQRITIRLGGDLVAETTRALRVLETHHAPTYYLPPEDVRAILRPAQGRSFCEWKGVARYFDVVLGDATAPRAAWSYDRPTARFAPLAGYLAFYAGQMEAIWVGEARVIPQPGDFYGGWVTPNLEGRIKGAPGTRHW
ncbi:DUF427 domain-containing protein [Lacimonas salitolerans]|uniref:DUF427 domain-containing protein n=1 Tax=Lacimonas salitolerans TaxID=1323750 RepID=A0ABW4EJL6_9RHOB